jgi:chromate reductase
LEIGDLPLYNQDDDATSSDSVVRLKREITALGLLFVTPEYNRSVSGVLKNAIDHASGPYGQSAWGGKPTSWVVSGRSRYIDGATAPTKVLAYLDVPTLGQREIFIQVHD